MPEPTLEITPTTVPALVTGTPSTVTEVNLGEPHPSAIDAAKELGLHRTLSPKEALGKDSLLEAEALEAQTAGKPLERDASGKFISRKDAKSEGEKPELAGAEKPAAEAKPVTTPPMKAKLISKAPAVAAPVVAEPVVTPKIKIGTEEKTAEEWQQHFEQLKAGPKQPEQKQESPKPPTPEERAKADQDFKAKRLAYIDKAAGEINPAEYGFSMTDIEYDKMLSGGPDALKTFQGVIGRIMGAARALAREETADLIGPKWNKLQDAIDPILQRESQIAEYQQHQSFLTANPDIGAHEQGSNVSHAVREELHNNYQQIQQRIASGTATPQDKASALLYDAATAEQFEASVAYHTRAKLGITPGAPKTVAATPAPAAAVAPPAKVPPKPSTPFNGDRPGGANGTPAQQSGQGKFIADLHQAGK